MIRTQTTVGTRIRILSSYTAAGTLRTYIHTACMRHTHIHSDTDCCTRRSRNSHADTRGVPPYDERPQRSLE